MKVRSGKTRIVLVCGDNAYKIGKLRPIRLFFRMLIFPFLSKGNHERFYTRYGATLFMAMWNYLVAGKIANEREYRYFSSTHDARVMPTVGRVLGGWIVIQKRGEKISARELGRENPFDGLPIDPQFLERNQPWQFCRNEKGKVVLVDYGRKETCAALLKTLKLEDTSCV